MDQKRICTLIQELLVRNERVLLPGVGELSVQATPAAFMQDGRTILPPGKKLLFNKDIVGGEHEPWQEELSGRIREAFARHREYEVPGVGIFRQDDEGETVFVLDEDFDFAPDSFTLEAISLEVNEVEPQNAAHKAEETKQPAIRLPETQKKQTRKWVIWVVAAVAVLVLLIILAVIFRESLKPILENLLYTEEELEIIQKWAAQ
ncbi:MAG: hypothetical protein IJ383_08140 [Bacteroidales bacterium]|nr:hypothetical protein [Bacteroidales bacterium]